MILWWNILLWEKGSFNFGKGRKVQIIFVGKRNVPSASSANLSKTGVRNQLVFFIFDNRDNRCFITPILKSHGGPCNLIGSNWCDLFTNRTIFCSKSHLFLANEKVTLKTKQPIRFQGLFKVTNQIAGKWKTKSIMWQALLSVQLPLLITFKKVWFDFGGKLKNFTSGLTRSISLSASDYGLKKASGFRKWGVLVYWG